VAARRNLDAAASQPAHASPSNDSFPGTDCGFFVKECSEAAKRGRRRQGLSLDKAEAGRRVSAWCFQADRLFLLSATSAVGQKRLMHRNTEASS
jgi:hypothetical protein